MFNPPSDPVESRFTASGPLVLDVMVPVGALEVRTVDGDEAVVSLSGAQKLVESTRVEFDGGRLTVGTEYRTFRGLLGRFDGALRVRASVPVGSRVEVVTASGDVSLEGSFASLDAKTASGDVHVNGELDGDVSVKTVSGDVRLPAVAGELTVRTVSGDVSADSVGGPATMKSVSGDVKVGRLREGKISVQSVSGDIALGIAPGTSIDIDAGSASGDLRSEVPLFDVPSDEPGPTLVVRGNTVSGDLRVFRAAA
jgi:DUF4097 and DUF4098 domain-containing protein YvlB